MKQQINVWDYAGQIMENIGKGILLTTAAEGEVDSMTIGWGEIGVLWAKPVFTVFVRESRYTKKLLEKNGEFTINVPLETVDKNILTVCGTKSRRDMDKVKELGLTLEEGQTVSVPGIRQLPLTLECKVIYKQDQEPAAIQRESYERFYAVGTRNEADHHTAYYGQITAAYIIK